MRMAESIRTIQADAVEQAVYALFLKTAQSPDDEVIASG